MFFLGSLSLGAQSADLQFTQFVVDGLESKDQAIKIQQKIAAMDGVERARVDIVSGTCIFFFYDSSLVNKDLEDLFAQYNVETKCFRTGSVATDKVLNIRLICEE
jgi:hypothetical protein